MNVLLDGYINALCNTFNYKGRTSRAEYWSFETVVIVLYLVSLFTRGGSIHYFVLGLLLLHLPAMVAVTIRRLHDCGENGWVAYIYYLALAPVAVVLFGCIKGTVGPNEYGSDPTAPAFQGGVRSP